MLHFFQINKHYNDLFVFIGSSQAVMFAPGIRTAASQLDACMCSPNVFVGFIQLLFFLFKQKKNPTIRQSPMQAKAELFFPKLNMQF